LVYHSLHFQPVYSAGSCNVSSDCEWCGSSCETKDSIKICPDVQPPDGYVCGCSQGICTSYRPTLTTPPPSDDDDDELEEDENCLDAEPPVPSWSSFNAATQTLSWSAMGGDKVRIKFSGDPGDLKYYFTTENDGHEQVGAGTTAGWFGGYWKIRTVNGCKYGDWSDLQSALSSTRESTVPATGSDIITGVFIVSCLAILTGLYLILTQTRGAALAKFEKRINKEIDKSVKKDGK